MLVNPLVVSTLGSVYVMFAGKTDASDIARLPLTLLLITGTPLLHRLILGARPFLGHFSCLQGDALVIQVDLITSSDPGLRSSTLRLNIDLAAREPAFAQFPGSAPHILRPEGPSSRDIL